MKTNDKNKVILNYAKIRSAKNPSKSIQRPFPQEIQQKPDHFYGYFGDNLNEKNMSYIEALKKPIHSKTFSCDTNYVANFPASPPFPKIQSLVDPVMTENTTGNDADIDEEEKAKINRSFSVEIVDMENRTPDKNPSALYVGRLKTSSQRKETKKSEFLNFIDETISYFEEIDKTTMPSNSIVSTKRKKFKNFHYSIHNEKPKSTHSNSQVMEEMSSIYVIQNQKLMKSKTTIEELKLTQKTLVKEIADHQEREKAYIKKIQEMEEDRSKMKLEFDELKSTLKMTQELLAKEKIDNENSLFALKKTLADQRLPSNNRYTTNPTIPLFTKSQNNYTTGHDSSTESYSQIYSKFAHKKAKDSLHLNNEVESNTLEMSSDMEISYDKDLYLMLKRLKHTQNDSITPKYHQYQRSLDSKKMCYTENSHNYNRKSFHDTSRIHNKARDWFSLHLGSRPGTGLSMNYHNSNWKQK